MTEETTTEQLAEIEGQATGYTPPEGWRVVRFGEELLPGDVWVNWEGTVSRPDILHGDGTRASGGRYIRRIKPQPQLEPVPAVQGGLVRDVTHLLEESGVLDSAKAEQRIEELRSEVSYVQNLLGTERRRVTQLEELVGSLRTINEAQEKAFNAANKANDDLQHRLNVVAAEWAEQAETIRRLQIELDAAQQVPADSPELRQLWANLAEVAHDRDTYKHAHELLLNDVNATHQRTKAETVEAIAEWLVPVQAAIAAPDNVDESTRAGWFAEEVIQHLPSIMRSLTGLDSLEDVD